MDFDKTTIDDKTKVRGCINQFFRPKYNFSMEGAGNCETCTYDPLRNPQCRSYYPITMRSINVVDKLQESMPPVLELEPQYQL
jgi:hypothetical protein